MSHPAVGYGLVLLALLFWAGNALVGRMAPDAQIPPLALNFWRWMVAFLVLAPIALPALRTQSHLFRKHWRLCVIFGLVTVAGFNPAFYIALQHTTVVQGTLITGVLPVLVLIAARIFLAQPIAARQIGGVLISIFGVAAIITRGEPTAILSLTFNVGDVWMLLAVCLWSAQTILIRFLPKEMDVIAFQVAAFVPGLLVALPFYVYETASGQPMPLSVSAAASVAYAGLFASVLGFTCWNMGVLRIGAKTAGYFSNLYPVLSAALGILILGEALHWYHAAGALVIFAGIYLAIVVPPAGRSTATETR